MAAIIAAAQGKAVPTSQPQPAPAPIEQPIKPAKMVSFTIIWQEGSGKYDGKVFTTWATANEAMTRIYNEHEGAGYLKVKINVKWENGSEITDRADCSDSQGDFCAKRETIGQYLSRQNSVMYQSNINKGDRVKLSFEDQYLNTDELGKATMHEFLSSPNLINDVAQDQPELSSLTIDDLLQDEPGEPQNSVQIVDYSEKAFAVVGETKQIKELLKQLGGRFNMYLKCGAGWIFPKTKLNTVKAQLSI